MSSKNKKKLKKNANADNKLSADKKSNELINSKTEMPNIAMESPANGDEKLKISTDTMTKEALIALADTIWKKVKEIVKSIPDFTKWDDKEKLKYFNETLNFKEFMNEFPIVSRYQICMGQYSSKAFGRFLDKIRNTIHPPPEKREKDYMRDQWIRRQSDYVRYLWESYQKRHFDNAEAQWVWQSTYKQLKGEFDDFTNKYKEIEKNTKEEKVKLSADNAKDLLERLKTGLQKLSPEDEKILLRELHDIVYKRRFANAMAQITSDVKLTEHSCEGQGQMPEVDEETKKKATITMVEHLADDNRLGEVPENLRMTEEEYNKLPGRAGFTM